MYTCGCLDRGKGLCWECFEKAARESGLLMVVSLSSFTSYLNRVWDFLIHLSFFNHQTLFHVPKEDGLENKASRFAKDWSSVEPVDCAVCLSTIEEDDEIQVLRCKHLFHRKCLDRCVEYQHTTCPLCRDYLAVPRMICELGREVIVFSFCGDGSSSNDDYDRWWLR
ncbi:Zinc finger, RING/FYVE/PHD-type [Artemisia annua]|uniref:Zinc finger, RING/FYVE/PHD-type n=1 Tax=Artemisia annua TaxID=35608 RepID=A0A2U1N1Z8_ARTAN|nr:Zinc finger, RING/FYVE/PHD-type [Artemisia annua]